MQSVSAGPASPRTSTSGRPRYQAQWQWSALVITVVFSAYALALLIALLTTGTLSDHVGRRPVLLGALAVQVASIALFATAGGLTTLIGARVLQGMATGAATGAAGAALLDMEDPARPGRAAPANSIAPVTGMAAGVLAATLMVRSALVPTITVYAALMAVFTAQAITLVATSETVRRRPGALRSTRPHLALPSAAAHALLLNGAGALTAGFGLRAAALTYAGCLAVLATVAVAVLTVPLHGRRRTPPPDARGGPAMSNHPSASAGTPAPDISVLTTHHR
ncbi:MFS transporter [Streptomyces sp. NPDC051320]|uniref:MFS transporter n=1 Tax=Streptomyces sp. NPDC051320 TaxID=3154644 RepID=UPI0034426B07